LQLLDRVDPLGFQAVGLGLGRFAIKQDGLFQNGLFMRIVHCFRAPVGGVFRHVRDLCDAQIAEGHELGIVCDSTTGGPHEDRLLAEIAPKLSLGLIRTPMQRQVGLGDVSSFLRTLRALRAMRPDILHGHGAKGGVYARTFGTLMRLSGRQVARLYSPHGGTLHHNADTLPGKVYFGIERSLERITDHLIFVSEYESRTYKSKIGMPRCPVSIVYNGLRATEFEPVTPEPGATDFLYIGTMRDLKGPDLFIAALKQVEEAVGGAVTATLVGDGEDLDKYIAQAKALNFGERVRFLPAMPARNGFRLGRIMVVPSRAEAMPYIVLEGLAAGKPLIATRVGGIPEIFGAESEAMCDPSAASLAQPMAKAFAEEAHWKNMMPSETILKGQFSIETMAGKISGIYHQSLSP